MGLISIQFRSFTVESANFGCLFPLLPQGPYQPLYQHRRTRSRLGAWSSSPYSILSSAYYFTFPGKGSAGQYLCLVTKALGGDVKSLFAKRGIFPFPIGKCIILHLFRGIAHAHSRRGVVHSDLKRDNTFLETTMSTEDTDKLLASNPVSSTSP